MKPWRRRRSEIKLRRREICGGRNRGRVQKTRIPLSQRN